MNREIVFFAVFGIVVVALMLTLLLFGSFMSIVVQSYIVFAASCLVMSLVPLYVAIKK